MWCELYDMRDQKKKNSSEKNILIPAAAGPSPSMQHLVFWPHAGAWGAGVLFIAMRSACVV